jgi:polysaccharide biosynthesis protein PslG
MFRPDSAAVTALVAASLIGGLMTAWYGAERWSGGVPVGERTGFSPGGNLPYAERDEVLADLDAMQSSGARWVRLDFPWRLVERQEGTRDWSALDRIVEASAERDLKVLALLAYTPEWARRDCDTDKCPPDDPGRFADFAAAAAERYGPDRVQAWQVWNEPNIASFWAPEPDVERYAALLTRAVAALRGERPEAFVVSGGLAPAVTQPGHVAPLEFLAQLTALGALRDVDALGWHPYSGTALPLDEGTREWNAFWQMERAREHLVEQGLVDVSIWATEYGVATGNDRRATSEEQQADMIEQAVGRLADGTWPWLGALFVYSLRDTADDPEDWQSGFGVLRHDGAPKPSYEVLERELRRDLADSASRPPP